jgi:hypothetical protein
MAAGEREREAAARGVPAGNGDVTRRKGASGRWAADVRGVDERDREGAPGRCRSEEGGRVEQRGEGVGGRGIDGVITGRHVLGGGILLRVFHGVFGAGVVVMPFVGVRYCGARDDGCGQRCKPPRSTVGIAFDQSGE